jgi:large subunit ribosomal protein L24
MPAKMKIRKNDTVQVLAGKDKGRTGTVLKAMPQESKVVVQGINVAKRHTKPSATGAGGIVEKEMPIHISNVALIDPESNKPTRVGYQVREDGRKVRIARRSGAALDK